MPLYDDALSTTQRSVCPAEDRSDCSSRALLGMGTDCAWCNCEWPSSCFLQERRAGAAGHAAGGAADAGPAQRAARQRLHSQCPLSRHGM